MCLAVTVQVVENDICTARCEGNGERADLRCEETADVDV